MVLSSMGTFKANYLTAKHVKHPQYRKIHKNMKRTKAKVYDIRQNYRNKAKPDKEQMSDKKHRINRVYNRDMWNDAI